MTNKLARAKTAAVSSSNGAGRPPTPLIFHVPAELNLDAMFDGRDVYHAACLLDILHQKLITWDHDPGTFVPLKREYLTRYIPPRRLTHIRSKLEKRGVITVNRSYSVGRYSKGYRLERAYW